MGKGSWPGRKMLQTPSSLKWTTWATVSSSRRRGTTTCIRRFLSLTEKDFNILLNVGVLQGLVEELPSCSQGNIPLALISKPTATWGGCSTSTKTTLSACTWATPQGSWISDLMRTSSVHLCSEHCVHVLPWRLKINLNKRDYISQFICCLCFSVIKSSIGKLNWKVYRNSFHIWYVLFADSSQSLSDTWLFRG